MIDADKLMADLLMATKIEMLVQISQRQSDCIRVLNERITLLEDRLSRAEADDTVAAANLADRLTAMENRIAYAVANV